MDSAYEVQKKVRFENVKFDMLTSARFDHATLNVNLKQAMGTMMLKKVFFICYREKLF